MLLCDKFVSNSDMHLDCNLNNKILNLTNNYVQDIKLTTYPYCSRLFTIDIYKWDDCNLNNKILNLTNSYARILNPIHSIASVPALLIDRLASLKKLILDESCLWSYEQSMDKNKIVMILGILAVC